MSCCSLSCNTAVLTFISLLDRNGEVSVNVWNLPEADRILVHYTEENTRDEYVGLMLIGEEAKFLIN